MQFDVIIGNPPYQLDDWRLRNQRRTDLQACSSIKPSSSNRDYLTMVIPASLVRRGQGTG